MKKRKFIGLAAGLALAGSVFASDLNTENPAPEKKKTLNYLALTAITGGVIYGCVKAGTKVVEEHYNLRAMADAEKDPSSSARNHGGMVYNTETKELEADSHIVTPF